MKAYEENLEESVKLVQDEDAVSPREDDNFGTMVCWHRNYNLGDKHEFSEPSDFQDWWEENGKGGEILSLRLYDHSGISMSTGNGYPFNDQWDSMQVGWIYVTAETIRKEYSCKRITKAIRKKVQELLNCEVETFDQYITGDVWGFVIEDEDGKTLDSCWGFFGSDYAKEEALSMFKHYVEKAEANRTHREAATIADNLTP